MTKQEQKLMKQVYANVDAYDYADAPFVPVANPMAVGLTPQKGNPAFDAQFNMTITAYLFTVAGGVFTRINSSALSGEAGGQVSSYLFGLTDYLAGYAKAQTLVPLAGWVQGIPFASGKDQPVVVVNGTNTFLDATALATLRKGDIVVPYSFTSTTPTNFVVLMVHRCQQVEYATLLTALSSDSFKLVGIRYTIPDTSSTGLLQFNNPMINYYKSLFGKFNNDSTDVTSFKQPTNFQNGIIDVPITMPITKADGLVTYFNISGYGAVNNIVMNWSVFVLGVNKPQQRAQ